MTETFKIRKGQLCAIGERRATGSTWTYTIGRVAHASAKGDKIRAARVYRYGGQMLKRADEQGRWWQSYAIRGEDMQAKAARFVGHEWATLDEMRAALLSA